MRHLLPRYVLLIKQVKLVKDKWFSESPYSALPQGMRNDFFKCISYK